MDESRDLTLNVAQVAPGVKGRVEPGTLEVGMSQTPIATARAHLSARLLDLSLGGALLALGSSLEVGAVHEFALELGERTLRVRGQVRHCRPADRYTGYHVGVSFIGIETRDEDLLGQYLGGH